MAFEDVPKTAIITPFGMFEFLRMPLGLKNTGKTFQLMMDQILGNLPYCFVYVDDILIFSPDLTSHVHHLQDFLELRCVHGLAIGLGKCEFAIAGTEFLGHRLTSTSLHQTRSTPPPFETFLRLWINLDFKDSLV